jgi:High potential iron-sulfur protein
MPTVITSGEILYNPFLTSQVLLIWGKMTDLFTQRNIYMEPNISRRAIVKSGLMAAAFAPFMGLLSRIAVAAGLPPLDPADPTAKALGFVTDASKVDAKASPTFKPSQKCGTCAQFQGKAGDATAGCNIFAGKSVPATGWCMVWVQKT